MAKKKLTLSEVLHLPRAPGRDAREAHLRKHGFDPAALHRDTKPAPEIDTSLRFRRPPLPLVDD